MRPTESLPRAAIEVHLRRGSVEDLATVNGVIERAVMGWNLPERVKRLSLPSYRYSPHDLQHLQLWVAEDTGHSIIGAAAWEPADSREIPAGKTALLLHGLYVDPSRQRQGVGARLLDAALAAAREEGCDGLLVKAQPDAEGFFAARGLQRLSVEDPSRDYPHRFWRSVC